MYINYSFFFFFFFFFFGIIFFAPWSFYRTTSFILTSLFFLPDLYFSPIFHSCFFFFSPPQFSRLPPPSTLSPRHKGKARTHPDWLKSLFTSASPPAATSDARPLCGGESLAVSRLGPGSCYLNTSASFGFISSEQTGTTPLSPGHQHGSFNGLWVRDAWHD